MEEVHGGGDMEEASGGDDIVPFHNYNVMSIHKTMGCCSI
jgi:hypothetical protein